MAFSPYRNKQFHPLPEDQYWSEGDQPVVNPWTKQLLAGASFVGSIGLLWRAGQRQWTPEKRGWDFALQAIRAAEEYSPGRIFRTFQLSHILSPLESASRIPRIHTPQMIHELRKLKGGRAWLENFSNVIGEDAATGRVGQYGFSFSGGELRLLNPERDLLLANAGVMRSPSGAHPVIQEGMARSVAGGNIENLSAAFREKIPFYDALRNEETAEAFSYVGGASKFQSAKRFAYGWGTAAIERLNKLAKSPAELPGISHLYDKINRIPGFEKFSLGVESSSGLKVLGKLSWKFGVLGGAAYLGYKELDYHTRKSPLFEGTIFDEGITAAAATVWTKGQMAFSRGADALGLHGYREWQERVAPGSTDLSRLAAFPLMGALGGVGIGYFSRVRQQFKLQTAGYDLAEASLIPTAIDESFKASIYGRNLPEKIASSLSERGKAFVQEETEKHLSSWEGKLATSIAAKQEKRGALGFLSRLLGKITPSKLKWMGGAALGTAVIAPFLPGALVPSERPEELEALYSGEAKVPIRKGRWWEFGRTPWEGNNIDRFQQHWYPRMLARGKEKALWGEDDPSPLKKWYLKNFTYYLEQKHYYDRPYPVSSGFGEDIPFVGPIIASTVGRLIKPPRLMHTEEYMREGEGGGIEYRDMPLKFGETRLPGDLGKGEPISPFGVKSVVGEEIYRAQEAVGLPGFVLNSIYSRITGNQDVFAQEAMLESAGRMAGIERDYWDKEMGGLAGTSELWRRLYPHRRREIDLYNPIENQMPSWLPGPGERSPDFRHGDPFTKVQLGEERLPGPGYAALHPDVEGLSPEEYPLMHRLNILADIAPYSDEYGEALGQVKSMVSSGMMNDQQMRQYHQLMSEISARKNKKQFDPYIYRQRANTPVEQMLTDANEAEKAPGSEPSWFERTMGSYWQNLAHQSETSLEYLTPVSPASKFVHERTALEDYRKNQIWGTQSGFWEHPIRDFLHPFAESLAHAAGDHGIPGDVMEKRNLEEYFDLLEYVKYTRLEMEARVQGDMRNAMEWAGKRRETLFGVDPYTFNYTHIMRALPRRDRDYFDAFTRADMDERAEIYNLIPENEKTLMNARWQLKDTTDTQLALKKGLITGEKAERAEAMLSEFAEQRSDQGMPKDKQLWIEYQGTRGQGESYPDWYRRTHLLQQRLAGRNLPGPDWVGFNPLVDLEDIKMKVVDNAAKNAFEYDLWPDRLKSITRKPYIADATSQLEQEMGSSPPREVIRGRIEDVLSAHGIQRSQVNMVPNSTGQTVINMDIREDRSISDRKKIRKALNNARR